MQDLTSYNSFGLQVHADNLIKIRSIDDLRKSPMGQVLILGSGSDVLLTEDYHGTVLVNEIRTFEVSRHGDDYIVKAGGGLVLDELIEDLIARNIPGLENLSAIPGTVGAAPIQNVGAYGMEIGQVIESISYFDLDKRIEGRLMRDECEFGYRSSVFKNHPERRYFVTEVILRLPAVFTPKLSYKGLEGRTFNSPFEVREQVIKLRRAKLPDPKVVGNAGSFFKNPLVSKEQCDRLKALYPEMPIYPQADGSIKLAAGWLIDKAGCRNITHGHAGTWEHQALVIVNRGQAKPHEIVALAKYIVSEVHNCFDIQLVPEVRVYGAKGEIAWKYL